MLYSNKPFLQILFICALFLLPTYKAASDEPFPQVSQIQINLAKANEKISTLELDQQKTSRMINTLQTSLNTAYQKINDLKVKQNKVAERTANGHGR